MKSIKTKIIILTLCAIVAAISIATTAGVIAVRDIGNKSSEQLLHLMCETGQKNLDSYFKSVEQSADMVSNFAKSDLLSTDFDQLSGHVERTRAIFDQTAKNTSGILTYYYRIDPEISESEKGFWCVYSRKNGFEEHDVTDINLYDTSDTSALVWFTVPKTTGEPKWLAPYITETLGARVISYNVPIFKDETFIGVVGIEIDFSTMAAQVNNIRLSENGYAFVTEENGDLVYHPNYDLTDLSAQDRPEMPTRLIGAFESERLTHYSFDGVEKMAITRPLHNGMMLTVAIPVSEINHNWRDLIVIIILISMALIVVFVVITLEITGRITKPLKELTRAAEQLNAGNYDLTLDYKGDDEVGILTDTINRLIGHLRGYIGDLSDLAYGDALTSVNNKGAFDTYIKEIQEQIDDPQKTPEFAIGMFDCNGLKTINDLYGHEKGDLYLKNSCFLICRTFRFSPVFRVGGDEFAVILKNQDYQKRTELERRFNEKCRKSGADADKPWENPKIALGIAVYDPESGESAEDVVRRADMTMYENKRGMKQVAVKADEKTP